MGTCSSRSIQTKYVNQQCIVKKSTPYYMSDEIIKKLSNSIVRIEYEEKISTGFFMKIYLQQKQRNFLITCEHCISQKNIDSKITVLIYYKEENDEIKKEIELNNNKRFMKCFIDIGIDITLIEIIPEDIIPEDKYLFPDLNYKNGYDQYKNRIIFAGGYPNDDINKDKKQCFSPGKITQLKDKIGNFLHNCATKGGSSGSPLINLDFQVVGIHYGCNDKNTINYGSFIGIIIDKLYIEENKINFKSKEINSIKIYKKDDKEDENIYNTDNKNIHEKEIEKNDDKEMLINKDSKQINNIKDTIKSDDYDNNEQKKMKKNEEQKNDFKEEEKNNNNNKNFNINNKNIINNENNNNINNENNNNINNENNNNINNENNNNNKNFNINNKNIINNENNNNINNENNNNINNENNNNINNKEDENINNKNLAIDKEPMRELMFSLAQEKEFKNFLGNMLCDPNLNPNLKKMMGIDKKFLNEMDPAGNGECMSPKFFEDFWNHALKEELNREKNNKNYDNDILGDELDINNFDIDLLNRYQNNNILNNQMNINNKNCMNPQYSKQFIQLKNMGFKDDKLINEALFVCQGNLEGAIEYLTRNDDFEEDKK